MPTPVPAPTPAQIVTVAEIAMVSTDVASAMIAADLTQEISDAKWAATLLDISSWTGGVGRDAGDVKRVDTIEFFEGSNVNARLDLRNAVRLRYGLDFLSSESSAACGVAIESLRWFD
jgi:hypothetical protein